MNGVSENASELVFEFFYLNLMAYQISTIRLAKQIGEGNRPHLFLSNDKSVLKVKTNNRKHQYRSDQKS